MPRLVIGLIVVAIFFVIVGLLAYMHKRNKPKIINRIHQQFASEGIIHICEDAYYMGLASHSPRPVGGYGGWVLTNQRIFFQAYLGPLKLDLPFDRIKKVKAAKGFELAPGITKYYRGKQGSKLLVVDFLKENEKEERTAWYITELDEVIGFLKPKIP